MNEMLIGLFISLGCSLMWGIGYAVVQPVSDKLRPDVINVIYYSIAFLINLIIMLSTGSYVDVKSLNLKLGVYFAVYILTCVVAASAFLYGYTMVGSKMAGAFNAISSTYPVFTFIIAYIFFNQRDSNLYYSIPGLICVVVGITLLCLSR